MLKKLLYTLWLVLFCAIVFITSKSANITAFIDVIENRTFDLRQNVLIKNKANQVQEKLSNYAKKIY